MFLTLHAIMRAGMVPVNPPSILGYRDTAMRNQRKAEVLLEDIAFLNKCVQVWVFSDIDAILKGSSPFSEGALCELLYVKHFRPHFPIFFVKPESLLHEEISG